MDISAIVKQVMDELEKKGTQQTNSAKTFTKIPESKINYPTSEKVIDYKKDKNVGVDNPVDREMIQRARSITPARIGIGRTGTRMKTKDYLDFRIDHAAAQDAVF
ncbi:MAG: ethanolamine ammonia-lyase light chain EutC, partial [Mesobacillus sp.]|uniref:ethanolamine ammonia-lyase light chain EutC n=1 Tax=Mesobacillus sp. TaxID=2675271 RepID=UPI003C3BD64D